MLTTLFAELQDSSKLSKNASYHKHANRGLSKYLENKVQPCNHQAIYKLLSTNAEEVSFGKIYFDWTVPSSRGWDHFYFFIWGFGERGGVEDGGMRLQIQVIQKQLQLLTLILSSVKVHATV